MSDTPEIKPTRGAPITALGFDFGTRHIGLAIAQTLTSSARPLLVLPAKDGQPNWPQVLKHIEQWLPDLLIVGLPLNIDGSESEFCARARKFARRLEGRSGYKVVMVDERLSTREAKSLQPAENYRQAPVDALAASLILESWLAQPSLAIKP